MTGKASLLRMTAGVFVAGTACLDTSPVEPQLIGEGTRVLFIGNSHTYVNDVPGILQALADSAAGERIAVMSVANANYALIDHWNDGMAARQIDKGQWKYVVMQQGWTPAGVCRDTLRLAARRFSDRILAVGAQPALYQIWPPASRPTQYLGTVESYRLASEDVNGLLIPAAEVWREAQQRDPTLSLYADDIHASIAGSYLTALVMYVRILRTSPVGLPSALVTRSGVGVSLAPALATALQQVAEDVARPATPLTVPTAPPVITSVC